MWVLLDRRVHVAEQHALGLEVFAVAVVDDLGLVLRGDAGEILALRLGDPQLLVGVLDRLRHLVPVVAERVGRLDVVEDVVEIDVRHVAAPVGHRATSEALVALESEVEHPVGLALQPRHLPQDVLVQAFLRLEDIVLFVGPAELVFAEVDADVGGRHGGAFQRRV